MENFDPVLRFAVMSDIHVKTNKDCRELERLDKGMKALYAYADGCAYKNVDAIYVVGDFANGGREEEMQNFASVFYENIRPETEYVISVASHEYGSGIPETHEKLKRIFGLDPNTHRIIKGFHFISVSPDHSCRFEDGERAFAAKELAEAFEDDADKPIFFFQHPHISGTVYGSVNWGEDDLTPVLVNYPQIIDFSGHSHAPVNDPRSVHQRWFTCFGTGSLSYTELDEFDKYYGTVPPDAEQFAQYLIVEVDAANRVLVKAYDIITGRFFPCDRLVEPPFEPANFIYTDDRYATDVKPHFNDGTPVTVKKTEDGVSVTFGQAVIAEDMVDDYTVTVRRASDGKIVRQITAWSDYYLYDMPDTVTVPVTGLEPGDYTAEITAKGFWLNKSDNSLKTEFSV